MGESYTPGPDEYVRPPGRYFIPDPRGERNEHFDSHYVRGAQFNPEGFSGHTAGQSVGVEMVREPGNPHHAQAIALLVGDGRIGYMAAGIAEEWQWFVIEENQDGMAVFAHGLIENVEEPRATIFLPWMSVILRSIREKENELRAAAERERRGRLRVEAYRLRTESQMTFAQIAGELGCSASMASKLYREYVDAMPEAERAVRPSSL